MYRYTNIKKVLTFIPSALLEEEDESTLLKWVLQGYTINVKNVHTNSDIKFAISQIVEHNAVVPVGFKTLFEASYSSILPSDLSDYPDSQTIFTQENYMGNRVTIFQAMFYATFKPYSALMCYRGQNKDIVYNGCKNFLCNDGAINFSIDKSLSTITTDVKEGYVLMLYSSPVQDESLNFLIPDDPILLQALAMYVEAKNLQDRAYRKEEGTNNMFVERMQMANNYFKEFQKKDLLSRYDPDHHVFLTQTINRIPGIQYQLDRHNIGK